MQASFSSAFLRGDPAAVRFLPDDFRDPAARSRVVARAAGRPRPVPRDLLDELRAQDRELPPSAARAANLDALGRTGTVAVITGQQVGLFLGPLYTFYKAASAIALARAIEEESGVRCVPIFWLQTEDHDFEEIRSCRSAVPQGDPITLSLRADEPGSACADRTSIAHRPIGDEVSELLATLDEALRDLPHAGEMLPRLRAHYQPGRPLAAAFAGVLAELFADEGLIVFNPRGPAVARLAAPVIEQALLRHTEIARALGERGCALRAAGYAEQIPVRSDATLFFFHRKSPEAGTGPRYRLEDTGAGFRNPDPLARSEERLISRESLRSILRAEPLRFSTSALLRPLLQDTLFPTVAYVGGPGEISYFAQLSPLYSLFQIAEPLVVPRGRFRVVDDRARSLLRRIGLAASAIEAPCEEVLRRALFANPEAASRRELADPAAVKEQLLADLTRRIGEIAALDPGLRSAADRTCASVTRNIERFAARYGRLRIERESVLAGRVERAQALLFPCGMPQERCLALPSFVCEHGLAALKRAVFERLRPEELFSPAVRDLEL